MNEDKYCPFRNGECARKKCALFIGGEMCAIAKIAKAIASVEFCLQG